MTIHPGRLAVFSPFYYPEPISTGKVNALLANELVHQGWQISVVCSHPLYPDWKPLRTDAALPATTFYRGGSWMRYPNNPLWRRVALELWFTLHAAIQVVRLPKDTTVALMVYPPSLFGPVVQWLLPRRVRRVALVHDLQGEYSQRGYHSGFSLLTWLINKVEERCLKGSDRCIFFSRDIARVAQETFGLDAEHLLVQYPFVTIDPQDAELGTALAAVLPEGVPHVVYSGALGEKQNPRVLVQRMETAAAQFTDVQFHVFSAGPIFAGLRKAHAGGAVQFHELIPEEQLAEMYARSTVQLVPQAPGTENGSLPSKLPNLLAAGVQVMALCSEASEVAGLLREAHSGTVVPEWSEAAFMEGMGAALREAKDISPATRKINAQDILAHCRVGSLAHLTVH